MVFLIYFLVVVIIPTIIIADLTRDFGADMGFCMVFIFFFLWGFLSLPVYEQVFPWGVNPNYGTGKVEGVVTEVAYQGTWHKTYETTIVYDTENPKVVCLSTNDEVLGNQLNEMVGTKVVIKYNKWRWAPRREGETGRIIQSVKPIE
jgi:hypothetical protein